MDWEFIKEWNSIADAKRGVYKADIAAIQRCCAGKKMSHKNFRWTYSDPSYKIKKRNI
jgi:hypothetical protein